MPRKVCLHAHTKHGSYDASLAPARLEQLYADAGFDVLAVTDHDAVTEPPRNALVQPRGIEHTVSPTNHLHVVELVDHDFRFLCHPRLSFPVNTREMARRVVKRYDLDGVEKYNSGVKQYHGDIGLRGVVELANDDAHNHLQVGHSYMTVPDDTNTESGVVEAIRHDQHSLENDSASVTAMAGLAVKGMAYVTHTARRSARQGPVPDRGTHLYAHEPRYDGE